MAGAPKRDGKLHEGHRKRMKQLLLEKGGTAFSKHELVEMLLYYAVPRKDTNELAHRLLDRSDKQLSRLFNLSYEELRTVDGMTNHPACLMLLLHAVINELEREQIEDVKRLDTTQRIGEYLVKRFVGLQVEQARLLCLDNKGNILADSILSEGSANSTEINLRQALQAAVRCNATVAVLAHNHPGGKPVPSRSDVHMTEQMIKALDMVGVTLADHIVVAGTDYLSMRETPITSTLFS